ncbi:hypothetical protein Tco_0753627 [Tanacetum coccineum]
MRPIGVLQLLEVSELSPFGGLSDIGYPGVDGPPVMPKDPYAYVVAAFQAPPSPDYMSGPEYPPLPEFIPEPVYPEFMPPDDDILPAEEQPLPAIISPTADSPGYVPESDPEEDPEEDDDEDPEEDPADYPVDGGDNGDDEYKSSDDDEDDDVDIKREEEEEHPAPADSTAVALLAVDHAPSVEETEPFKTNKSAATPPPHPAYRVTARISIRDEPPTPFWSDTEVARLLAIPTPPPSPLSPWSPPLLVSPPLPLAPPPLPVPLPSGTPPLLPIPLPTSSPPLHLPSADHGAENHEVCLPPRKRLCIAFGPRYEVGESSSAATARPTRGFRSDYGFVATMDREIMWDLERDITKFATRVRQDTDEIYTRLDDEQSEQQLMAGRLNMLYRDMRAHARNARLIEAEDRITAGSDYRATSSRPQETGGDFRDAGGGPQEIGAVHRGTEAAKETSDAYDRVRETAGTRQRSCIARCTRGGW